MSSIAPSAQCVRDVLVVPTASIQAYDPSPTLLAYPSPKAALVNFTKALSEMAMSRSVRVNAGAHGPVWPQPIPSTLPKDHYRRSGGHPPSNGRRSRDEIAPLSYFWRSFRRDRGNSRLVKAGLRLGATAFVARIHGD